MMVGPLFSVSELPFPAPFMSSAAQFSVLIIHATSTRAPSPPSSVVRVRHSTYQKAVRGPQVDQHCHAALLHGARRPSNKAQKGERRAARANGLVPQMFHLAATCGQCDCVVLAMGGRYVRVCIVCMYVQITYNIHTYNTSTRRCFVVKIGLSARPRAP